MIEPRVLDDEAIAELSAQMRRPDQRRADLRAQLAAGRVGRARLLELRAARRRRHARRGLRRGARLRRAPDARLPGRARRTGTRSAQDVLEAREGDLPIALRATVAGDQLTLDFTGTADQHDGNLNCPLAVTRSACYFAVRVLTDPDIPANAGAYRPVEVIAPEGCLLNARSPGGGRRRQRRDLVARRRRRAARVRPRARPGDDEQRHARRRARSSTTRRSAAARAPAPTPTDRAASTWR